ncbi:PilZ domain-containing protein [Sphingomonas sp.]|uniref:PilZ domain-containing protein n=1 Tax=Sphingomonas sp. TaxID=28214 RepID=UPI00286A25D0|nr:PilZ domain-containing protein [Sphingomonas sp.]
MKSGIWPERRPRHAVRLEAAVTRDGGEVVTSSVTDLSLEGCCLSGAFKIGEQIRLKIPRVGMLSAQIRWSFMNRAGARFVSSIPLSPDPV